MESLLALTAILESVLGAALFTAPSIAGSVLFGGPLNKTAELILGRLGGAAILSLSFACRMVRNDAKGSARTVVTVMAFYNIAVSAILVYALFGA